MVVQACNRAGIGPSSQEIITTTLEDGRSLTNCYFGSHYLFIYLCLITFAVVIIVEWTVENQTS